MSTEAGSFDFSRERRQLIGCAVGLAVLGLIPLARAWELAADLGHGWVAPLLAGYLWWERWAERPRVSVSSGSGGPGWVAWLLLAALLTCALPLRLLLTPYPLWVVPLLLYVALVIGVGVAGAGMLAGKAGVRWLGGPLIIFIGVIPWPGVIDRAIILPLREGIAALVAEISNLAGHPALAAGTSVRLAGGWVGIEEACGGIRSLQAVVTVALFFGVWLRLNWKRRGVLLAAAVAFAVAGNFARVLFLAWCANQPPGVLDTWHDPAGWGALGASLIATGVMGWWLRAKDAREAPTTPVISRNVTGNVTGSPERMGRVCLWLIVATIGLSMIEGGTRWWFSRGGTVRQTAAPQWSAHLPVENASFRRLSLSKVAEEKLRPDLFFSGVWLGADGVERSANLIEWHSGQVARYVPFLHNPASCLPYAGCELVKSLGTVDVPWAHGVIPFHAYIFRRMNEDLVVAFVVWDPVAGRPLEAMGEGWAAWWQVQWQDVLAARQHQPAQLLAFAIIGQENQNRLVDELAALVAARN